MATHTSILTWRIPTDRGAWRATVHRVTKSRTQVEQLSKAQHRRVKVCNVKVNKLYHGNLVLFLVELSSHTLEISHDTTVFCLFLFLMLLNLTAAKVVSLGQGLSSPYIVSQNPMINHIVLQEITYSRASGFGLHHSTSSRALSCAPQLDETSHTHHPDSPL